MKLRLPLGLRFLPKRLVSRVTGLLVRCPLPSFLLRPMLRAYAKAFGANLEEMGRPLGAYRTFVDFFARPLAEGARPQPDDPLVVTSPCDGHILRTGTLEGGTLVQAKGIDYRVEDLLGDEDAARFRGGSYCVLYLAPGDYHRYHWPFAARAQHVRHVPGDLWSVDVKYVERLRGLYVRNERVVVSGEVATGGTFACVLVGAMNVGSIRLSFHDVSTRQWFRRAPRAWPVQVEASRGDELGWFELGSSIVLLLTAEAGRLDGAEAHTPVRVGHRIGRLECRR